MANKLNLCITQFTYHYFEVYLNCDSDTRLIIYVYDTHRTSLVGYMATDVRHTHPTALVCPARRNEYSYFLTKEKKKRTGGSRYEI